MTTKAEQGLLIQDADIQPAQEPSIMQMIDYCMKNQGSVEIMERLIAMRDHDRAYHAERAYNSALEEAQQKIKSVAPDAKNANGKPYASFTALHEALQPIYKEFGLRLSFYAQASTNPDEIIILCDLSHSGGHMKTYSLPMSTDNKGPKGGGVMSKQDAIVAATTRGRNTLLRLIFNILVDEPEKDEKTLDDLNERLENMRDGDRASLKSVYAANWAAAVEIGDMKALWQFIKLRLWLCQSVNELMAEGKAAMEGVAAFRDADLNKAITASINTRKGELLK